MATGALIFSVRTQRAANGFSPFDHTKGISPIRRMIIAFQMMNVSPIILLTQQRGNAEQHLAHMGVICMGPEDLSEIDYSEYLPQAFSFLKIKCQQIFFAPADYPLINIDTIKQMKTSPSTPVQPTHTGRSGYPILASFADIDWIAQEYQGFYDMDTLMSELETQAQHQIFQDEGIVLNLSKKNNWEDLLKKHEIRQLRPVSKFTIAKETVFLGPGAHQLLEAIELTDSVRSACKLIGISYSKGWQMIRIIENQTGFPVVERQKGGQAGGFACLSAEGKTLLQKYAAYVEACSSAVEQLFQEYFGDSKEDEHEEA